MELATMNCVQNDNCDAAASFCLSQMNNLKLFDHSHNNNPPHHGHPFRAAILHLRVRDFPVRQTMT